MPAPSTTARQAPVGKRLTDGYPTTVAFALRPAISFWEISVQAPGFDGGEPINITTMLNTRWRTFVPKALITMTPFNMTVAYDPRLYVSIINSLLNKVGSVTVHFSNGDTLDFFGALTKFEPQEVKEGEMPQARITVVPTNYDTSDGSEQGPVHTAASGTGS